MAKSEGWMAILKEWMAKSEGEGWMAISEERTAKSEGWMAIYRNGRPSQRDGWLS
jgi:hypothetical protein